MGICDLLLWILCLELVQLRIPSTFNTRLTLNRPSSYIIVRLPIGKYISVSVYVFPPYKMRRDFDTISFLWGGILMCHAACSNWNGLMTVRFFLGVGEAAIAPGFTLLTGMFYKREEQPLR